MGTDLKKNNRARPLQPKNLHTKQTRQVVQPKQFELKGLCEGNSAFGPLVQQQFRMKVEVEDIIKYARVSKSWLTKMFYNV